MLLKYCSGKKTRLAIRLAAGILALCASRPSFGQNAPPARTGYAAVSNIRLSHDSLGATLEITSSRPLEPEISQIDAPPRIVIDLPNSRVAVRSKRINVGADRISAIRVDQFQDRPPVTRVVVDLLAPHKFLWSTAGNILLVTLEPETGPPTPATPSEPSVSPEAEPAVVPVSSATPGGLILDASQLAAGSTVTAGSQSTSVRLSRGGEVRVCPGTTVSVTPSRNGRDLMLAMSTGALETHYKLDASSDSVLTPDFRIQFPGPGEFHFAVNADSHGNTCVRSLMGNTASAVVSELMGDRTYQVKPTDQLVFHSGRLDLVDTAVPLECGCPPAPAPVLRAQTPPEVVPDSKLPATTRLATGDENVVPPAPDGTTLTASDMSSRPMAPANETAPLPPLKKEDVRIQIDAPIVFRASDSPPAEAAKQPPPAPASVATAKKSDPTAPIPATAQPPTVAVAKAEKRGFFSKVGGFFAAIFR